MKLIVYTCITNNYDWLSPPLIKDRNIEFICFADARIKVKGWQVFPIAEDIRNEPPNIVNRRYKMFPSNYLPSHDWSLYVDGNIQLIGNPWDLVRMVADSGSDIGTLPHLNRYKTIKDESSGIKRKRKIHRSNFGKLDEQTNRYTRDGLPRNAIVHACGVIIRPRRESGDLLNCCMNIWWDEYINGVRRDQISFPYALWASKANALRLPFSVAESNNYFRLVSHKKNKWTAVGYIESRRFHSVSYGVLWSFIAIFRVVKRRVRNLGNRQFLSL